jgi:hypothetical protein
LAEFWQQNKTLATESAETLRKTLRSLCALWLINELLR